MDILYAVTLLIYLCSIGSAEKCSTEPFEHFPFNEYNICIEGDDAQSSNGSIDHYNPTSDDINLELNSTTGVLSVMFPLAPSTKYRTYRVELKLRERLAGEDSCEEGSLHKKRLLHSAFVFDVFRCSDVKPEVEYCTPSCNKMGVIAFKYVFSGCYEIDIQPRSESHVGVPYGKGPVALESEYIKQTIWENNVTMHHQCFPDGQDLRVSVNSKLLKEVPTVMTLMRDINLFASGACTRTGQSHACCTYNPADENTLGCEPKKNSSHPDHCELMNDSLECTFQNIQPGNYCVAFNLIDNVRCQKGTIWTVTKNSPPKTCIFTHTIYCPNITFERSTTPIALESTKNNVLIPIIVVICCSVVVFVVVFVYRKRVRNRFRSINLDLDSPVLDSLQPRVLLLYAQDCKEFMQLMTTFRSLLINVGQCEVLDCFDNDRVEEMARGPVEWMRYYASLPDVKVVIVASNCSVAHQKALSTGTSLQYRDPLPNSHLFLFGLKEITYNHKKGEYTNTFVVRFDESDLSYFTPYTRFMLPKHLMELLKNLNPGMDDYAAGEYKDEQKLQDDHAKFIKFKEENPKYVTELLAKCGESSDVFYC